MVVVVAAGAFVGSGLAERAWRRWVQPAPAPAGGAGRAMAPPGSWFILSAVGAAARAPLVGVHWPIESRGDGIKIATFLGDATRRVYGIGPAPGHLDLIWRTFIGSGLTSGVRAKGDKSDKPPKPARWAGTGWTGQPCLVRDGGRLYLIVGGFDHDLHRIDAATGKVVWEYAFDDIIKSSPSVIEDPDPPTADEKYLVLAGSRRGFPSSFTDPGLAPYRAVAFGNGREVWRLPVPLTRSYSRDCDGSGFDVDGRVYAGVESGWFYKLDPFTTSPWNGFRTPHVVARRLLLGDATDATVHGGNLVLEASPSLIGDTVYVSSGAGHVYGLRRSDLSVVWDYRIGSDLDGTPVPTDDGKLLVPVEKQYIRGHGGVLLLDPSRGPKQATVWFFPTGDRALGDWAGGVIGSVAVNDAYDPLGEKPRLAAFIAIDGYLYVVAQRTLATGTVPGPNLEPALHTPRLVARFWVGGGISTPIIVGDALVAAGYDDRVHLYRIAYTAAAAGAKGALPSPAGAWWKVAVHQVDSYAARGAFESTPIMWKDRVFIGSRDGDLYCLGDR